MLVVGEDVGRHGRRREHADEQHEQRHAERRVRTTEREAYDPHAVSLPLARGGGRALGRAAEMFARPLTHHVSWPEGEQVGPRYGPSRAAPTSTHDCLAPHTAAKTGEPAHPRRMFESDTEP